MENLIIGIFLAGYLVLSVWGYRAAAEQVKEDSAQARREGVKASASPTRS